MSQTFWAYAIAQRSDLDAEAAVHSVCMSLYPTADAAKAAAAEELDEWFAEAAAEDDEPKPEPVVLEWSSYGIPENAEHATLHEDGEYFLRVFPMSVVE